MPLTMPLPTAAIDAIFHEWDRLDSPGCALGVIHGGALAYARGYGAANLEYGQPIAPSSVFHVASVSKHFTATAIVLLAQEGKLGLDDDIRRHLPELPDFGATITIRQMLNHISGLRDQWELLALAGWRPDDLKTNADVLDLATRQRELNFIPGAEWLYSNMGYTLAALIVERTSGQSLRAFLDARIFAPLGMARTHFHDDHSEIVPGRAYAYVPRDGGGYRISIPAFDTVGATSLFTTVEDLARWINHLARERVAATPYWQELTTLGLLNSGEPTDYALGLRLGTYKGTQLIEHSGGDAGYRAHLLWLPDEDLAIAILCNLSTTLPGQLARRVADLCLGRTLDPQPADSTRTPEDLTSLTGLYQDPKTGTVFRVHLADGTLKLATVTLTPLADGRFRGLGAIYQFSADDANPRQLLLCDPEGKEPTVVGTAVPAAAPTPAILAGYTGTYHSPELDVTYTLVLDNDTLTLRRRKFKDRPLHPTIADTFTDDYYHYAFARDAERQVTGFTISTGRIRHLRFDRREGDGMKN
jgi:CubicO group peptidase (beta-lactamase class C family)